jgi:hypothetical protein
VRILRKTISGEMYEQEIPVGRKLTGMAIHGVSMSYEDFVDILTMNERRRRMWLNDVTTHFAEDKSWKR